MKAEIFNVDSCEEALKLAAIEFGVDKEELDASKVEDGIEVITIVDGVDKAKQYLQSILDAFGAKGYIEKMTKGSTIEFNVDVKEMNGVILRCLLVLCIVVYSIVECSDNVEDVICYVPRRNLEEFSIFFDHFFRFHSYFVCSFFFYAIAIRFLIIINFSCCF